MPGNMYRRVLLACIASIISSGVALSSDIDAHRKRITSASSAAEGLFFSPPNVEPVALTVFNTVRYSLDTESGGEEFSQLLPTGGHVVYIADRRVGKDHDDEDFASGVKAYTVTLFHQLKCLDIIRQQLFNDAESNRSAVMSRHCINYLRQTILCSPNLRLESATSPGTVTETYETVCRDWTTLYEEAERNYRTFLVWRNQSIVRPGSKD